MSKIYTEIKQLLKAKHDRLKEAEAGLLIAAAAAEVARRDYGQLEAEGDQKAPAALERYQGAEKKQQEAADRLKAMKAGEAVISPKLQDLARQLVDEAIAEIEATEAGKAEIMELLKDLQANYIEKLRSYYTLQDRQGIVKKHLDEVIGTYPGGSDFPDQFNRRPKIHLQPVSRLPLVTAETAVQAIGRQVVNVG